MSTSQSSLIGIAAVMFSLSASFLTTSILITCKIDFWTIETITQCVYESKMNKTRTKTVQMNATSANICFTSAGAMVTTKGERQQMSKSTKSRVAM